MFNVYLSKSKKIDKETAIWVSLMGGLGIQSTNYFLRGSLKVIMLTDDNIIVEQVGLGKDGLLRLNIPTYTDVWMWLCQEGFDKWLPTSGDVQSQIIEHVHELVRTVDPMESAINK